MPGCRRWCWAVGLELGSGGLGSYVVTAARTLPRGRIHEMASRCLSLYSANPNALNQALGHASVAFLARRLPPLLGSHRSLTVSASIAHRSSLAARVLSSAIHLPVPRQIYHRAVSQPYNLESLLSAFSALSADLIMPVCDRP